MSDLDTLQVAVWPKAGEGSWAYPPTAACVDAAGVPRLQPMVSLRWALGDHEYDETHNPEAFPDWLFNGVVVEGATDRQYRIGKRYADLGDSDPPAFLHFVSLDFDRTSHKTGLWASAADAQAACEAVAAFGLVTKASPAGLHAFVRCPEPVPVAVASAYVAAIRAHYEALLGHTLRKHGLKPADPLDWQQGLRIGRCVRLDGKAGPWGTGKPPMDLSCADEPAGPGERSWVADFRPSLSALTRQRTTRHAPLGELPDPWPQAPEGWTGWVRPTEALPPATIAALDAGLPVTGPGDRDEPALRLVASLAAQIRHRCTREQLFGILAPSFAADESATLDKVWRHIGVYHHGLRKSPDGHTETAPDGRPYIWKLGASRGWNLSRADGTSIEVASEVLVSELERQWPDLEVRDEKGRPYTPDSLNRRYGCTARTVEYDHGANGDRFDFDTLTYTSGIRTPTIQPEYNAECDEFLSLFGPKFLDWIAAFGRRERPCAALVLKGGHSNGKGMLVAALRVVAGGFCSVREALHPNFQQARIRPGGWFITQNEKSSTRNHPDDVKALIDEESHDIQIKKKDSAVVRGYTRVLMTSNKADPFNMIADMSTDEDDVAIGLRTLTLDIPNSSMPDPRAPDGFLGIPAAWLAERGGNALTRDGDEPWVGTPEHPGKLVRHIAHVIATRQIIPGSRLLVEGEIANWRVSEARKSEKNAKVLDGLVLGIVAGKPLGEREASGLWLSCNAYRESWASIHKDRESAPSLRAIGEALTQCGIPKATHAPLHLDPKRPLRRYVPASVLIERAADLGLSQEDVAMALSRKNSRQVLDAVPLAGQLFGNRPKKDHA